MKGKHDSRLDLEPTYADIVYEKFNTDKDWTGFYGDFEEAIPPNAPMPHGKSVYLRMMVYIDHAGDNTTRHYCTSFMIFLNMDLIQWLSKKQPNMESAVFEAKNISMKHGVETLRVICYKLRMMGVPIEGPSFIYGGNISVIYNTSRPDCVLSKK